MNYNDILLSLLAVAMGSLTCLGLIKTDKDEPKFKVRLDTADVDTVALTAIATFIALMAALHPPCHEPNNILKDQHPRRYNLLLFIKAE